MHRYHFFSVIIGFCWLLPALAGDFYPECDSEEKEALALSAILKDQDAVFNPQAWGDQEPERESSVYRPIRTERKSTPTAAPYAQPLQDQIPIQSGNTYPDWWLAAAQAASSDLYAPIAEPAPNLRLNERPFPATEVLDSLDEQEKSDHGKVAKSGPGVQQDDGAHIMADSAAAHQLIACDVAGGVDKSKSTFFCEFCNRPFLVKGFLTRHRREKHNAEGEKKFYLASFTCNICGKSFTQNGGLKLHIRTHTGEQPYECVLCGRRFSQKSNLKRHIQSVCDLSRDGETKYLCEVCGFSSSRSDSFQTHLKRHEAEQTEAAAPSPKNKSAENRRPYGCEECPNRFNTKSNLRIHMRTHTGEKPYSCKTCSRRFRTPGNLKSHERIHTGEKDHACSICGEKFMHRNTRNNHEKRHE